MGNRQIKKPESISEDAWTKCWERGLLINVAFEKYYKLDGRYLMYVLLQNGSVLLIKSSLFVKTNSVGFQDIFIKEKR